jgi:hypothetical protein
LETKAELRSNSQTGPNDQSGPRAIHGEGAQSQVIELPGSHAIFLSHAHEVAALIEKAAAAAK